MTTLAILDDGERRDVIDALRAAIDGIDDFTSSPHCDYDDDDRAAAAQRVNRYSTLINKLQETSA